MKFYLNYFILLEGCILVGTINGEIQSIISLFLSLLRAFELILRNYSVDTHTVSVLNRISILFLFRLLFREYKDIVELRVEFSKNFLIHLFILSFLFDSKKLSHLFVKVIYTLHSLTLFNLVADQHSFRRRVKNVYELVLLYLTLLEL